MSRVLKNGREQITSPYDNHNGWSRGVDIVRYRGNTEDIVVHTDGKVIKVINYMRNRGVLDQEGMGYGNYVMIQHSEKFQERYVVTLYAHLNSVFPTIVEGMSVRKGQIIGRMGNSGNAYGAHLHFEIRLYRNLPEGYLHNVGDFSWIDPTPYLNSDLPQDKKALTPTSYNNYESDSGRYYRVRMGFSDIKSSKGAFTIWTNAYNQWEKLKKQGYHIYNNEGTQLD